MDRPLRVGIIGASAERGWAKVSHVPAVQALSGLTLAAVVTTDQKSAETAARAFGVETGYGDAQSLFLDATIDIVTVAVKVPDHRALVLGAIAAGKHVYCEWPLGRNLAETEELAAAAHAAGIHAAIGLQTRTNPAARRARALIASGAIGRVLSASIVSTTMAFGPNVEAAMAFSEDPANGVTLVTVQGGHTMDFACATLGCLSEAGALVTTQFAQVDLGAEAIRVVRSTPDHILVQAHLAGGSAVSIEVAGGRRPDAVPFCFEVIGDAGTLSLNGGAARGFQSGRLRLRLNGQEQHIDQGEVSGMSDTAANVAGVYAALRDDILNATATVSDFDDAVRLSRLVEDVQASAKTGIRASATYWPV